MDKIITDKEYPIQKRWVFKSVLFSFLFIIIYFPAVAIGSLSSSHSEVLLKSGMYLIFFLIFLPFPIVGMILRRATFHYSLDKEYITIYQGVISKSQIHIRYGVIQNILIGQDIFDRLFRVVDLRVQNAVQGGPVAYGYGRQTEGIGVSGNTVEIPGLDPKDAQKLKDEILQKVKTAASDTHSGL